MSINYFTYENCYPRILNEASFNEYKDTVFEIHDIDAVDVIDECENFAIDAKTQFFLISDLCNNPLKSKCYVPKFSMTSDYLSDTLESTFRPFSIILKKIFGDESERNSLEIESSDNLVSTDLTKCLHYLPNGKYYASKGNFALYNSSTLNQNVINALKQIKSYDHYVNQLSEINNYDSLIKKPNLNDGNYSGGGNIATTFKQFICNPTSNTRENFNFYILELEEKYKKIFSNLNEISNDLSNISLLTKNDSQVILEIDTDQYSLFPKIEDIFIR